MKPGKRTQPRQGSKAVADQRRHATAEDGARFAGPGETLPVSIHQGRLGVQGAGEESEGGWKTYGPQPEKRSSRSGRLNTAGVCALSRRLMATERARALGRRPLDPRAWALEQEARNWTEGRRKTCNGLGG